MLRYFTLSHFKLLQSYKDTPFQLLCQTFVSRVTVDQNKKNLIIEEEQYSIHQVDKLVLRTKESKGGDKFRWEFIANFL